jgi:hypothetical protein
MNNYNLLSSVYGKYGAILVLMLVFVSNAYAQVTGAQINEATVTTTVYVDQSNPLAADSNPGTRSQPFLTVGRAIVFAGKNIANGTRIVIGDGTYREALSFSAFSASNRAPLIIEAKNPQQVVVSGADVWTGWLSQSDGTYTHPWPYRWGNAPTPARWPVLPAIVTRREMVFVNQVPLKQSLSLPLPGPGTFNVLDGGTITIWPPAGTDLSSALVEVATRAGLLVTPRGISNLVLRGLVFEDDGTAVNGVGNAAVKLIGGSNILIDDCTFNQNNWDGLSISGNPASQVTIQNSEADGNGENGIAMSKVENLLFQNDQTSSNNWRGAAGGFVGFDADGMKISRLHDAALINYVSSYNHTGGVWLDTDSKNVMIANSQFCGNLTNGIFVEASEGPVNLQNVLLLRNVSNGLQVANSTNLAIMNSVAYGNKGGMFIGGSDSARNVSDFETGEQYSLYSQNISLNGDVVAGTSSQQYVLTSSLRGSWASFVQTLSSDHNDWYGATNSAPFSTLYGRQNLAGWQRSTRQDANSTSVAPSIQLPSYCGTPDQPQ